MTKPDDTKKSILKNADVIVFHPDLARIFDVCGALLIQQIHYWTQHKPHVIEGHAYNYNTYEGWAEQLGCYGTRTVANTLRELEAEGIICVGVFNQFKYDRTRWYRINYPALLKKLQEETGRDWKIIHEPSGKIFLMGEERITQPIPKTNHETTKELKTADASTGKEKESTLSTGKEKEGQGQSPLPPFNGVNEMGNLSMALSKHHEKKEATLAATPVATKPADVVFRWKHHLKAKHGAAVLTDKDAGKLKHIFTGAPDRAIEVIDYIHLHWDKFLVKVNAQSGTHYNATEPTIPIAVMHYKVALWQLIAGDEAKKNVPKIQAVIDKPSQVAETTPKEELASPDQVAASLALFPDSEED